jgi:hypothetical protein
MNLMDITKKFATPEACVHFLEGIGWQSIADVESLLCQVDHRAVYFRQTAAENSYQSPVCGVYPPSIPKTLKHPQWPATGAVGSG